MCFLVRTIAYLRELNLMLPVREFKDSNGVFYPRTTKLLVIVAKQSNGNRRSFPFELRIEKEMKVTIHHFGMLDRIARLLAGPKTYDSWCFKIKAPYSPSAAQEALYDARRAHNNNISPSIVGLHAAVKPWMNAIATYVFVRHIRHTDTHFAEALCSHLRRKQTLTIPTPCRQASRR